MHFSLPENRDVRLPAHCREIRLTRENRPREARFRARVTLGMATLVIADLAAGCHGAPNTVLAEIAEARRVAADLRIQFSKASNASDRAVLSDDDEESAAFARQAVEMKQLVARDSTVLSPLLGALGYPIELKALESFTNAYAEYEKLDRTILELAIENTNLKAQRLLFGSEQEVADAFKSALEMLLGKEPARNRCRLEELSARAIVAMREIQVLQAPHIAAADDVVMERFEQKMRDRLAVIKDSLGAMEGSVGTGTQMASARAAFERFEAIYEQIVKLSRRNSNVRSLELSLRQKPLLAARCDQNIAALQEALAREGFSATR